MRRNIEQNSPKSAPSGDKSLAIMQPYFLPYLGYWQLMQSVDEFIVYDDVQFSKGGWINRNRLLLGGAAHTFTLPLRKGRLGDKINERYLSENHEAASQSLLAKVSQAYGDAPFFAKVMPVFERIMTADETNLGDFLFMSLEQVKKYVGLKTPLLRASELDAGQGLRADERVLAICKTRDARLYVNAPGGRDLYDKDAFREQGLDLKFIEPAEITYPQFDGDFVPSLSILDVMMFNDPAEIRDMLTRYRLD
ncbi:MULTISPECIES: WbqC family protein [unclassified Roseovarius]|uniref:WbqC family protein n=1 Tax=unclassified Roseovarius TaxID=2614913 RepID=UPI00273F82B9|nr:MULTISPECIES: WbqC family protein [unclassified Roseovarius]